MTTTAGGPEGALRWSVLPEQSEGWALIMKDFRNWGVCVADHPMHMVRLTAGVWMVGDPPSGVTISMVLRL